MTGIKRRLGSLLGPAGYNATGAAEDQQTIASYMAARIGANPVSEALDEVIDAQTTPVRSRANAAHALAQNVSGRVDAFEVLADLTPGNVDDATIALHVGQANSLARDAVARVVLDVPTNLINLSNITQGYVYPSGAAEPQPNSTYGISDWIPVVPGADYAYSNVLRVTFFGPNRAYVNSYSLDGSTRPYTTPTGAQWARLSIHNSNHATVQMNRGSEILPYEPGGAPKIKGEYLPDHDHDQEDQPPRAVEIDLNAHRQLIDMDGLNEYYQAPVVEAQPDLVGGRTVAEDVYEWYDDLMDTHPDYVTRETIGASEGIPMYKYTFKTPEVPTRSDMTHNPSLYEPSPTVLLLSGVHGYERAGVYTNWRLVKALCDEWDTSRVLEVLRWNVEFVVIPLGNPYAYNEGIRYTANGVDVARNFPAGWQASEPGSTTYGGPYPLSEPETQAIYGVMEDIADRTVLGLSHHNFSANTDLPEKFIWQVGASPMAVQLGKKLITRVSRHWRNSYEWVTNPGPYYGYVSQAPPGSEASQMVEFGFIGSTFETSRVQFLDGGDGEPRSSRAMTLALDALTNYVALGVHTAINLQQ